MKLSKIKGAVLASIIVLSVGVIAVKAAPSFTYAKVKETSVTPTVTPTETPTVTPSVIPTETPSETITVSPIVISSTKYKEVTLLSKSGIEQITGFPLTSKNISSIYKELKKDDTWKAAGYSEDDAKLIANRFAKSYKQSIGILKKLAKVSNLGLKVVIIDKPNYKKASIGVTKDITNSDKPTTAPTTTPTTTPGEEVTKLNLKELEISIEYKKGEIELEYEVKLDGTVQAEYKNDFTGENLKNEDAKVKIESLLNGLDIKESSQTTIVEHILNKLDIEKEYKEFQFEAEFYNGKKIQFEK